MECRYSAEELAYDFFGSRQKKVTLSSEKEKELIVIKE
jgi:hypothetical protein